MSLERLSDELVRRPIIEEVRTIVAPQAAKSWFFFNCEIENIGKLNILDRTNKWKTMIISNDSGAPSGKNMSLAIFFKKSHFAAKDGHSKFKHRSLHEFVRWPFQWYIISLCSIHMKGTLGGAPYFGAHQTIFPTFCVYALIEALELKKGMDIIRRNRFLVK